MKTHAPFKIADLFCGAGGTSTGAIEALRSRRLASGLTQSQVCARLLDVGVKLDRSALARIENQSRQLYDFEMLALVDVLGAIEGKPIGVDVHLPCE